MTRKKKIKSSAPAIHIGVDKQQLDDVTAMVCRILNTPAGDSAKVAGLETLRHFCEVKNVTIQNCNFEVK